MFSANFIFDLKNFPENISKLVEIGLVVLPAIKEIKNGKTKIEIKKNDFKNIDGKDLHEFCRLMANTMGGAIAYICPSSGNIIVRAEKPPP